ncbi:hypothetical protein [uncultured Rikenella sp.]|uniref:hypothetical protein n=1 Tax=uncultured Rikenella sp. TaxID=368003 RepID=UPI0026351BFE|nr:hypothetical protein [uncultured Rikenella sp.]
MLTTIRDYFKAKCPAFVSPENFVFGADEKTLKERIGTFGDYYLFLDYGAFGSGRDGNNRIKDTFELAVTIAMPIGANHPSPAEVEGYQLESFSRIAELRKAMLTEQRETPWLKYLDDDHQILPFVAPDLCLSVGSTLSFRLKGFDLLGVKG